MLKNLEKLVDRAFDWLVQNLELFDPIADRGRVDLFYTKAICELSLMCMLYARVNSDHTDDRINSIVSFIYQVCRHPCFRDHIIRQPDKLRLFDMPYVALMHFGIKDPVAGEIIQRVVDQRYAIAVETVPFRMLDLRHTLDGGGFKHPLPPYEQIYNYTLLAKNPSAVYLTDLDAYCVTHTLFYLADFGFRPIVEIPEEHLSTVRSLVGQLLGVYVRHEHWDLVGELLLSCRCLRWSPAYVFVAAWTALLDAQLPDGSISGPEFSLKEVHQENQSKQRRYSFRANYHTTLVSVMACVLSYSWMKNQVLQ